MSLFNVNWPINPTTVNTGPVEFQRNGATTNVSEDTVVPANSRPLPVKALDENGNSAIGATTETAPATDTAASGLNGRLQRIAQRLTSLIALLPASIGQKLSAGSLSIVLASDATLPLPTGASTAANQTTGNTSLANIDADLGAKADLAATTDTGTFSLIALFKRLLSVKLPDPVAGRIPVDGSGVTQPVSAATLPLPAGASTAANQATGNTSLANIDADLGAKADLAATTDTGTFSLIALFKRLLGTKLPDAVAGRVPVDGSGVTQPVSAATLPLPAGAATETTQSAQNTLIGAVTETAPASDTASSGLNGRLQRVAQRLTSLIALLPSSLGQKTGANSLAVVVASDQSNLPVLQKGKTVVSTSRTDYSTSNVGTVTPAQLIASTSSDINEIEIFDSSGQTLELMTGAAASEVRLLLIFPGGNGRVPAFIAAGTRVSIRAITAVANSGELDINYYS